MRELYFFTQPRCFRCNSCFLALCIFILFVLLLLVSRDTAKHWVYESILRTIAHSIDNCTLFSFWWVAKVSVKFFLLSANFFLLLVVWCKRHINTSMFNPVAAWINSEASITRVCSRWGAARYGAVLAVEYVRATTRRHQVLPSRESFRLDDATWWACFGGGGFFANNAISRRDLDLWPFDLEIGPRGARVPGILPTKFGFRRPFRFPSRRRHGTDRRTDGQTDRQTDRQTDNIDT